MGSAPINIISTVFSTLLPLFPYAPHSTKLLLQNERTLSSNEHTIGFLNIKAASETAEY